MALRSARCFLERRFGFFELGRASAWKRTTLSPAEPDLLLQQQLLISNIDEQSVEGVEIGVSLKLVIEEILYSCVPFIPRYRPYWSCLIGCCHGAIIGGVQPRARR